MRKDGISELEVDADDKIIVLREKIMKCVLFKDDEQFVKEALIAIVEDRKKQESIEEQNRKKQESVEEQKVKDKRIADERAYELEKLKLQALLKNSNGQEFWKNQITKNEASFRKLQK